MIKIVIDSAVPFLQGLFEPYAEVVYKQGADICRDDLMDADALIVRTRTKCDKNLLEGTTVKMIATATIGIDHIDVEYCNANKIYVQSAQGCNAGGVMNYVFSALYGLASRKAINLQGATFGVIGVGNVGSRVVRMAQHLGFKVFMHDPPRQEAEKSESYCSLDYLLENSQIVSVHVPLLPNTRGMCNEKFFDKMIPGSFFINTSRGEVVDDEALIKASPKLGSIIIDTWRNEPNINTKLQDIADIATPHIAGYSYQGKQNGTAAAVRAVARFFGFKELYEFFPETNVKELEAVRLDLKGKTQGQIASVFQYNYPIFTDDFIFRLNPENFDQIRQNYSYRKEFFID